MIADIRYAIRMLAKSPTFTFIAVLTLGLAIGANTAIFSVVNAVLLRPLPYPEAEKLVRVFGTQPTLPEAPSSPANFLEWRTENEVFTHIATWNGQGFNLTGTDKPERVIGARVSGDIFQLLRVQPVLGRDFTAEEDRDGGDRVVIVSYEFWQHRFAGDPNAIRQTITLSDQTYTIVGVMPRGFAFPGTRTQIWTPVAFNAAERATRDTNFIDVVARLKPGVSLQQAQANMTSVAQSQAQRYPETNFGVGVKVVSLQEHMVGNVRPMLGVLLGAVAFVLLIACANVANLLLARAAWQVSKTDLNEGLKESGRGRSDARRRQRMRALLVISEVALSLVLLIGAGLMIRSFARLLAVDPGFKADHVLAAFVSLPVAKYSKHEEQVAFFDRLLERLRNIPGVSAAGVVTDIPLYGGGSTGFDVDGRPPALPGQRAMTDYRMINSDYFAAMGMHMVKGRAFAHYDTEAAPGVVIINETMAARYFAGEDPIGQRLELSGSPKDLREIVGVVADVRNYGVDAEVKPEVYVPFLQSAPGYLSSMTSALA